MGIHAGLELAMCRFIQAHRAARFANLITHSRSEAYVVGYVEGCLTFMQLPLIMYPHTRRQVTPRKRAVGIRPRTFNYYCEMIANNHSLAYVLTLWVDWLPNHTLVLHVVVVFAVLNPLVIPFAFLYFCVESRMCVSSTLGTLSDLRSVVIRNQVRTLCYVWPSVLPAVHQLYHVYAKNYEGNGQTLLIRIVRYSCDGRPSSLFIMSLTQLAPYTQGCCFPR